MPVPHQPCRRNDNARKIAVQPQTRVFPIERRAKNIFPMPGIGIDKVGAERDLQT